MSAVIVQGFSRGFRKALNISTSFVERETGEIAPRAAVYAEDTKSHLDLWLRALKSFFRPRNHSLTETEQGTLLTRDWRNELRLARQTLLQCSQLALDSIHEKKSTESAPENEVEVDFLAADDSETEAHLAPDAALLSALAESLSDTCAVCDAMLDAKAVSFHAWSSLGKIIAREVGRFNGLQSIARAAQHRSKAKLQLPLLLLTRNLSEQGALGDDMLRIFSELANLLDRLRFIETSLRLDQPLKQTLPIFTLIHEETRNLLAFIAARVMRVENLDEAIFDALDGTTYAIGMELRKVFTHELTGLCAMREAPAIYARVENAHGLLRDSFQQSTVALAQVFDSTLDGTRLFNQFQTKLDQSLALRADLWSMLQLVRRAEKERENYPVARLLERLEEFREGSLRYLMYKDWETCERFIEEVSAARGAAELTPVLHRFSAYFETLHGQINMRAVLADYPFDYPAEAN